MKDHIRTLLTKTALRNRTQLALYAVTRGLCNRPEIAEALENAQDDRI